ncbi:hypothetical protein HDU86_008397 [Geranomyces michiganensis]|nr:hypothetical protein HDU86_008397 [Geranomyces michiganensis]
MVQEAVDYCPKATSSNDPEINELSASKKRKLDQLDENSRCTPWTTENQVVALKHDPELCKVLDEKFTLLVNEYQECHALADSDEESAAKFTMVANKFQELHALVADVDKELIAGLADTAREGAAYIVKSAQKFRAAIEKTTCEYGEYLNQALADIEQRQQTIIAQSLNK